MYQISFFGFNSKNAAQHTDEWYENFHGCKHDAIMYAGNKSKEFKNEFPDWMLIYKIEAI